MSPEKPDALLWMDVETTGLDANKCSILEIGLRCTTLDAMREHALLEAVVHISRETMLSAQLPTLALLRWITHLEQFSQITNQTKEDA